MTNSPAILEEEMVLEFVRAEIDSTIYRELYRQKMLEMGVARALIDNSDLSDPAGNAGAAYASITQHCRS